MRTRQDGANRWDQILGGDGNLIAELNDLQLDLVYARIESLKAGWFDRASVTYSFNTQREERVNQGGNGNPNALIAHEPERTTVNGVQFNASRQINPRQQSARRRRHVLRGSDVGSLRRQSGDAGPDAAAGRACRTGRPTRRPARSRRPSIDAIPDKLALTGALRAGYNSYQASAADAPDRQRPAAVAG